MAVEGRWLPRTDAAQDEGDEEPRPRPDQLVQVEDGGDAEESGKDCGGGDRRVVEVVVPFDLSAGDHVELRLRGPS